MSDLPPGPGIDPIEPEPAKNDKNVGGLIVLVLGAMLVASFFGFVIGLSQEPGIPSVLEIALDRPNCVRHINGALATRDTVDMEALAFAVRASGISDSHIDTVPHPSQNDKEYIVVSGYRCA